MYKYKNQIFNKLFLILFSFIFLHPSFAFAYPLPTVDLNEPLIGNVRVLGKLIFGPGTQGNPSSPSVGILERKLGLNVNDPNYNPVYKDAFLEVKNESREKINYEQFSIDTYSFTLGFSFISCYILSDNLVIGYSLVETLEIYENTLLIEQIKLNTQNNEYLSGQIILPTDMDVKFFEKIVDNYIERYGIAELNNREFLFLDSFYPIELDNVINQKIINTINNNLFLINQSVIQNLRVR